MKYRIVICLLSLYSMLLFSECYCYADDEGDVSEEMAYDEGGDAYDDDQLNNDEAYGSQYDDYNEIDSSDIHRDEDQMQNHVRSIVDRVLKINKHVKKDATDPKVARKLMKEQNISKQIDKLRSDIRVLENTLDAHYETVKKDYDRNNRKAESTSQKNSSNSKRNSGGVARPRDEAVRGKSSTGSSGSKRGKAKQWKRGSRDRKLERSEKSIYTVKNKTAYSNSYLDRINARQSSYAGRSYKSSKTNSRYGSYEYKIKCYGADGNCVSTYSSSSSNRQGARAYTVKSHVSDSSSGQYFCNKCKHSQCSCG